MRAESEEPGKIETPLRWGETPTAVVRPARLRRLIAPRFFFRLVSRRMARLARLEEPPTPRLRRHELSVVAVDLRGFTAFSESAEPAEAVELLREYYGMVGSVVQAFGGMIKEHAGDGTLALVGAAGPSRDHAERAVAMTFAILAGAERFLAPRRSAGLDLGIGIGVASGPVTVGTIEAASRIEPVAVGQPVNLAARLCARALAGEILVDERTLERIREETSGRFEPLEVAALKGFAHPVPIFHARSIAAAARL